MDVDSSEVLERFALAKRVAREAGQLTLEYFRLDVVVERKSDNTPVTEADREAEKLVRAGILAQFPDDTVIGEEFPERKGKSRFRWIVDPIDGTKSFIAGVPLYGTLLGLQCDGRSVAGVIEIPALSESVAAARGQGAWYQQGNGTPRKARVSQCADLGDAIFVTSERLNFAKRGAERAYHDLESAVWMTRTWGDCYGYLLVATGRADLMVDPMLNIWDAAALRPILEEAGGTFTDWTGNATVEGGDGIGTNGHILAPVLAITRQFPPN